MKIPSLGLLGVLLACMSCGVNEEKFSKENKYNEYSYICSAAGGTFFRRGNHVSCRCYKKEFIPKFQKCVRGEIVSR